MAKYIVFVAALLAALLQATALEHLELMGQRIDLVFVMALAVAAIRGPWLGLLAGLAGGLAVDTLSVLPFGTATVSVCLVALPVSLAIRPLGQQYPLVPMLLTPVIAFIYFLLLGLSATLLGWPLDWTALFGRMLFPAILLNTACLPVVYLAVYTLSRGRPEITWRSSRI